MRDDAVLRRALPLGRGLGPNLGNSRLEKPHVTMHPCHPWLLHRGDDAQQHTAIACRPDTACKAKSLGDLYTYRISMHF